MRWTFLLVLAAAPLFAEEPVRELDLWLERWQGGQKLGWERRVVERTGTTWRLTRERWTPIEGGQVSERTVTSADPRSLIVAQSITRTGPAGEWQASLAAVGTATEWSVRARNTPERRGLVAGRVFDPELLAWRIGTGKQPRPGSTQRARLFDAIGQEVLALPIEVVDVEGDPTELGVRLGGTAWWFARGGALVRQELGDGPGLELVPVADAATAADMGRARSWPEVPGLSAEGLRIDRLGLRLVRPGPGWELLRTTLPDGREQLGARHPDELTVLLQEVPLAPPEDEEARLRVGRVLTTLVESSDGPLRLTHPRPASWDGRPALELAVAGKPGGPELAGKAWSVGGRGGLLVIAFVPADQAGRLAARIDGARRVVALDPVAGSSGWKRVELPGVGATVEVPEEWGPASETDAGLVAPGALVRFSAARVPSDEGMARERAMDLVVSRSREQLAAKTLADEPAASLGGRPGRRVVLEGFSSPKDGSLATRLELGLVPDKGGGFTLLMGVAIESPSSGPVLERVMSSIRWKE